MDSRRGTEVIKQFPFLPSTKIVLILTTIDNWPLKSEIAGDESPAMIFILSIYSCSGS